MDSPSLNRAEELFAEFPEWKKFAQTKIFEDGRPYLVLEVAPPQQADVTHGLVVDTANDEVTVGFDFYHSHFNSWVGDGDELGKMAALAFIKQLVTERLAVISYWSDDQWRGSEQLEAGEKIVVPAWALDKNLNRIRVRSWNGSLNAEIAV